MIIRFLFLIALTFFYNISIGQCDTYLNIQNKKYSTCEISQDSIMIIVLYGKKRCEKCFDELYEFLSKYKIKARYGVLFEYAENDILTKKQLIKYHTISNYLISNYFFDANNNYFNKFNIEHTPAMIIYTKDKVQYIPYFQLFKKGVLDGNTIIAATKL